MVQFEVFWASGEATIHPFSSLPCTIGRDTRCDLCLPEPGVWDQHVTISLTEDSSFRVVRQSEGTLILNGEVVEDAPLRNGDTLELGGITVRFWLTPVRPRSQSAGDWVFWGLVGLVFATMISLMITLPR